MSTITRRERISKSWEEPMMDGSTRTRTEEGWAWRCNGEACGLGGYVQVMLRIRAGGDWSIMLDSQGRWWAMNVVAKRLGPFASWREAFWRILREPDGKSILEVR